MERYAKLWASLLVLEATSLFGQAEFAEMWASVSETSLLSSFYIDATSESTSKQNLEILQ